MALPSSASDLFRDLGAVTEAAVAAYRNAAIASNNFDEMLQHIPAYVTDRPSFPIIRVLKSQRTFSWRSQILPIYVPHSGWFLKFDEHPLKKQLITELLTILRDCPHEDELSQHLLNRASDTLGGYIDSALVIYHALVFRRGERYRNSALAIATDMLDERVNPQRAAFFSGAFLYNLELDQPEDAPIRLDNDLEIRLTTFGDVARLASFGEMEGKYLPPAYMLVFRHTQSQPVHNILGGPIWIDKTPTVDVITALRLLKGEYIGIGREWTWSSGLPSSLEYRSRAFDYMAVSFINNDFISTPPYKLSASDIPQVNSLYQHLRHSSGRAKLEVALSRLNTSYGRSNPRERLIDLVIALENLFGEETVGQTTEVGYRLRMRAARYLGANADERKQLRKFISQLYTLRSKIVHGDSKTSDEEIQKIFKRPFGEIMIELMDIVRRSLRMLLANPNHIGQEHFNNLLLGIED
jgi:hypothetical protein